MLPVYFVWAYPSVDPVRPQLASTTAPRAMEERTVFVLIIDELSLDILLDGSGDVDAEAFPSFHRFAGESVWFRQAMANYGYTRGSIPSALTGDFVSRGQQTAWPDIGAVAEPNLISVLAARGYRVTFYSGHLGCVGPRLRCLKYVDGGGATKVGRVATGVALYYLPKSVLMRVAPTLVALPLRFEAELLAALGAGELSAPGQASIVHLMVAHSPYVLSPEGVAAGSDDFVFGRRADVPRVLARYRAQVQYLDRHFGAFLAALDASGAASRSVVVLTADHGTCWVAGCLGRSDRPAVVVPSLVRVPMMIRAPGLHPRVLDSDYQHVDFYPTLLEVLGFPVPAPTPEGRSALSGGPAGRRRVFFVDESADPVDVGLPARPVELAAR